jgi:F-type H+-transporting ATPase subunit c
MRTTVLLLVMVTVVAFAAVPTMAEDGSQADQAGGEQAGQVKQTQTAEAEVDGMTYPRAIAVVGACIGAAGAALGGGLAVANIGGKCIESMARQPEAAGAMFAPMIITAAMVEGGMLFAILVCLLRS